VRSTIGDIYDRKKGAIEFLVKTSKLFNQRFEFVAELRLVLVVRHTEAAPRRKFSPMMPRTAPR
jgi:hypothetical protein